MNHKMTPAANIARRIKEVSNMLQHFILVKFDGTCIVVFDCTVNRALNVKESDENGFVCTLNFLNALKQHMSNVKKFELGMNKGLDVNNYAAAVELFNSSRMWLQEKFGYLPKIYYDGKK